jgi:hypothetical protein
MNLYFQGVQYAISLYYIYKGKQRGKGSDRALQLQQQQIIFKQHGKRQQSYFDH